MNAQALVCWICCCLCAAVEDMLSGDRRLHHFLGWQVEGQGFMCELSIV